MVVAELLRALSLLVLLPLLLSGRASLGWLLAMGFIGALGTVGFSVAAPALVPALVPGRRWRAPMGAWSWRAAWPMPAGRPWPAAWWPGPGPDGLCGRRPGLGPGRGLAARPA
jgi:hypothetical protein